MARDPVRELLQSSLAPVTDRQAARARVLEGATLRRRQDRRRTVALAVSATGAAAVAVFALVTGTAGFRSSPVVGGSPSARDTTPAPEPTEGSTAQAPAACVDRDIDPHILRFVTDWADGVVEGRDETLCLVAGLPGPAPEFDTSRLGAEIILDPTDTTGDLDPYGGTPQFMIDRTLPAVHVGRIGQPNDHAFITWQLNPQDGSVGVCLEGGCSNGPQIPSDGVTIGQGVQRETVIVSTWVVPDVAVVAVAIDGQPVGWQRPVARAAVLAVPIKPSNEQELTLTTYDADGTRLTENAYPARQ